MFTAAGHQRMRWKKKIKWNLLPILRAQAVIAVRELGKRLLGNSRRKADQTKPVAWEVTRKRMQRGSRAW